MPQDTIEERVAYLEGKVDEQSRGHGELRDAVQHVGGHIVALDQKVDRFREELSGRIDALDQKVSRHFVWIVGIQITILVTVVGVLGAALFRG